MVRHRKAEKLSWSDAGKAFDVLRKLVKDWEALCDKGLLTGEAGRRMVSPEQDQIGALRSELSRLKMENQILKKQRRNRWRVQPPLCAGEPVKYAFMKEDLVLLFAIAVICRVLRVTQAG